MAKRVLSIVIGNECTKVCEVSYKRNYRNKGIRVYRSISFDNPANSIEDGYIMDPELFGGELRKQLKAGKFKSDKVIFSIASSKIANREIILPPTRERRIMDIIKTGASEYFPIDIKDYILSYMVLEKKTSVRKSKALQKKLEKKQMKLERKASRKKSTTELIAEKMEQMETAVVQEPGEIVDKAGNNENELDQKKHMRVSVYAVPSSLVKNYYSFAKAAHLDIVSLDYSGNSSYQIIKRQVNRGTNVYVQLNERDTVISILRDDALILQRTVGYGICMLTDAIMEQSYYKVSSREEAFDLLSRTNLFSGEAAGQDLGLFDPDWSQGEIAYTSELMRAAQASKESEARKEKAARQYILESLQFLTNSIARTLDYYRTNHKSEEINCIYISGVGARIQGIDEFFYSEIGRPHMKMDKLLTVSAWKRAAAYRQNPGEFISCIGAVIRPIDFVPKEFIEKKQKRSLVFAAVVFTLACLGGSAGVIYVGYTDYSAAKQELEEVKRQKDALPEVESIFKENEKATKELESLQDFENSAESKNDSINDILTQLQEKLPTGTRINTMQFSKTGVIMSAVADDHNVGASALQAKLYTQLDTIPYFTTVDITIDSVEEGAESSLISFTIICSY